MRGRVYLILVLVMFVVIEMLCVKKANMFDPESEDYIPPSYDYKLYSGEGEEFEDTVHYDWVRIELIGNNERCEYRLRVDNGVWGEWSDVGEYRIDGLEDGHHIVKVECRYKGWRDVRGGEIGFLVRTRGYKPEVMDKEESVLEVREGERVVLGVSVIGARPLEYRWMRGGEKILEGLVDSIEISRFGIGDTGVYYCVVSNRYGVDSSGIKVLRLKEVDSIKGGGGGDSIEKVYKVVVMSGDGGKVVQSVKREYYVDGERITLVAIADSGYEFDYWDGDISGSDDFISFEVRRDVIVRAVFRRELSGGCEEVFLGEDISERISKMTKEKVEGMLCVPSGSYKGIRVRGGMLRIIVRK